MQSSRFSPLFFLALSTSFGLLQKSLAQPELEAVGDDGQRFDIEDAYDISDGEEVDGEEEVDDGGEILPFLGECEGDWYVCLIKCAPHTIGVILLVTHTLLFPHSQHTFAAITMANALHHFAGR